MPYGELITITEDLPLDMLPALEDRIERSFSMSYAEIGATLKIIQDGRLWRGGYASFPDYVHDRWHLKRSSSYAYITAANVYQSLAEVQPVGLGYSHALQMVSLSNEQRIAVAKNTDFTTATRNDVARAVAEVLALEPPKVRKIPITPPRGTAIIRSLSDLQSECADLLILSTPSDPPILTEIGQYLRPGCSFLVPFQVPMMLVTSDPSVHMLGILGVQRAERGDSGPMILEQDLYGWFSRGDYVGGRCSNRLTTLGDVVGAMTWPGDTVIHLGPTDCSVLHATVPCDRHYIAVNPTASVADAIKVYELDG